MKQFLKILTRGFNATASGVQRIAIVSQAAVAVASQAFKAAKALKDLSPAQMVMVGALGMAGGSVAVDQLPPELKSQLPPAVVSAADAVTDTGKVIGTVTVDMVDDVRSVVPLIEEPPDRTEARIQSRLAEVKEEVKLGTANPAEVELLLEEATEVLGTEEVLETLDEVVEKVELPEIKEKEEETEAEEVAEEVVVQEEAQAVVDIITEAISTASDIEQQTQPLKEDVEALKDQLSIVENIDLEQVNNIERRVRSMEGNFEKLAAIDLSLLEKELPDNIDPEEFQKVQYALKNLNTLKGIVLAIEPRIDDLEDSLKSLVETLSSTDPEAVVSLPDSIKPEAYDDSSLVSRIEALEQRPQIEVPPEFDPSTLTSDNIREGKLNLYFDEGRIRTFVTSDSLITDDGPLWDNLRIKNYITSITGKPNGIASLDSQGDLNTSHIAPEMSLPVGSIICWHGNLTGTPALPDGWAELNGSIVVDSESPYNGSTLPNYNGEGRFMRGSNTSGTLQAQSIQSHSHGLGGIYQLFRVASGSVLDGGEPGGEGSATNGSDITSSTQNTGDSETRPINFSCRFVIKIK